MEMSSGLKTKLNAHVGTHVDKYPADCNDLVMACNNLSEFTSEEKEWFSKALPHGTFNSPDDVKRAINL